MAKYGSFAYSELAYGTTDSRFVFDRTIEDLKNRTAKAYINSADLNRVETGIEYISVLLNEYFYTQQPRIKKEWQIGQEPKAAADMERTRLNIQSLMRQFFVYADTPPLPGDLNHMDIYKMNSIEKILNDLRVMISDMRVNLRECGVLQCGEG